MKFSYNWLQTFFTEPLPVPADLAEKITFHSSEIEEVIASAHDTVLDVKVLPDKSAWLMSHRGLAKEISVMCNQPLKNDPLQVEPKLGLSEKISITRTSATCDFYAAALVEGIKVGPSPAWLRESLEAVGQRSINNIVDATNYVMFELGQPLHAFAADKLSQVEGKYKITVRLAEADEQIVALTGETYELNEADTVIVDSSTNQPIAIAGVKGGQLAAVEENTTAILLESAHFQRVAVRNTARRLKLPTDASKRFENGISVAVAPIALLRLIEVIIQVAGGDCVAQSFSGNAEVKRAPVVCTLMKINSVLGLKLTKLEVDDILRRFGFSYEWEEGEEVTVTPTFERDDLILAQDLIEEIGRMYGLEHIVSIPPTKVMVKEFNSRYYYAEKIRQVLVELGFCEIYTSSFCNKDIVQIENALASDKGYLRSSLVANLSEAREKNIAHRDLLGLLAVKLFEIGTVFNDESEEFRVGFAVQTGTAYKAKVDDSLLNEAINTLEANLGVTLKLIHQANGIAEFSLDALLAELPAPTNYEPVSKQTLHKYRAFSVYPAITRDIALWVNSDDSVELVSKTIKDVAGPLLVNLTLFDEFGKEGKISYAFRLVFQSLEKTLTDVEVQKEMDIVYKTVANQGWEVR